VTLTLRAYLGGALSMASVIAALGYGSFCVRRVVLPAWRGAIARVAEVVIAMSVLFAIAQAVGAARWFSRWPVLGAELGAGLAMIAVGRRMTPRADRDADDRGERARPARVEVVGVAAGVGLVVAQWSTHTAYALTKGMTYSDTMWYHQPFAARFVQHHSFNSLDGVGLEAARLYPLNSPLLHALGMLAFGSDLVSPLINLAWMLFALAAAWCIGRRFGLGPVCTLAAAVAMGLPIFTATQPGQASSDIGTVALFLAAIALLLESDLEPAPVALAGLALGMAVSMKITVAAPAAVLAVGVLVLAWRARRLTAALWAGAIAMTGSFWFLRNWWLFSSPVPWFDLNLGPLHLPVRAGAAASASGQPAIVRTLANGDAPRSFYFDALWVGFGRVWPLVLVVFAVAIVLLVLRSETALDRVLGLVLGIGCLAYAVTPFTGGLNFASGLRFLDPLLLAGFVLLPLRLSRTVRWRGLTIAVLVFLALVSATMPSFERVPAWPSAEVVPTLAVLVAIGAAGLALARLVKDRHSALLPAMLALCAAVLIGGWFAQRHYFEHRYIDIGVPNDALDEYFRGVHGARVAVLGTDDTYPMFGLDLSNDVRRADDPPFDLSGDVCATWRRELAGYDYVAIAPTPVSFSPMPKPPPDVFADPSATEVLHNGDTTVYHLSRPLDPATCPSA